MLSGFVSIIGRPNAGKSTIFNALLKRHLSIVTPKAETTRDAIRGIYRDEASEITFIDTPGIFKGKTGLDRYLLKTARRSARDVDALILVLDAGKREETLRKVETGAGIPLILALNKIDLVRLPEAEELKNGLRTLYPGAALVELSAIEGFGIDDLLAAVKKIIKEGPAYYGSGEVSDKDDTFFVKEAIREQLLLALREEVPHRTAVLVDAIGRKAEAAYVRARIVVAKEAYKGIVIGRKGERIKEIGTKAREALVPYFKKRLFLDLSVVVRKDWENDPRILRELGYF